MAPPSRSAVVVYERPHPLRTRKVLIPALVAIVTAMGYGAWFYFR